MAIKYLHPATGEFASKEAWRWVAVYKDGTQLEQFELKGSEAIFHRFAEIDQEKLRMFKMVHDKFNPVILIFPPGAKLIHKYRNMILNVPFDAAGDFTQERRERFYLVGYELGGQLHGVVITHENQIIITDDFDQVVINA